jgi:membrane protein
LSRGLDLTFDEIYTDDVHTSLPVQLRNASVVLLGITLAVGLVVATSVVLSLIFSDLPFVTALSLSC